MKKLIGYIPTWLLYYAGHLVCQLSFKYPNNNLLFNIYQWCMMASSDIQDWAGLNNPWKDPENLGI